MRRYHILDGFRGYFLLFMLVNHLGFQGGLLIARVNHAELGYVQDAQGFIFISGLIVGLYYARLYLKGQAREMDHKLLARAFTLYQYSLLLLIGIVGAALLIPETRLTWSEFMTEFYEAPFAELPGMALLLYQPSYLDILPQYIFYLLVSPLLIRWILNGHAIAVAAGSVLLWALVQFGLHEPLHRGVTALGQMAHPDFALRAYFNPLAWQTLFVAGLVIGCGLRTEKLNVTHWFGPRRASLAWLALSYVLVFAAYRVSITFEVLPMDLLERFDRFNSRKEFGIVSVLNFAALGYLVTWILVSGAEVRSRLMRGVNRLLHALFNNVFLCFLGQHSLQVYAYHVALVYALMLMDKMLGPFSEPMKTAITIAGIASLAIPAWLHANQGRWRYAVSRAGV